jgi:hypothetical protein
MYVIYIATEVMSKNIMLVLRTFLLGRHFLKLYSHLNQ